MATKKIQVKRKVISLSVIGLASILYAIPHLEAVWLMFFLSGTCILLDLLHHANSNNPLLKFYFNLYPKKDHEYINKLSDASIFFFSTLLMTLIFSKEIMFFTLVMFIITDATAQIFGIMFHKGELFWNKEKTWSGVIISFLFALLAGYIMIKWMPNLGFSSLQIILSSSIIAIMGTANKLDNITMPWGAAILLFLLS